MTLRAALQGRIYGDGYLPPSHTFAMALDVAAYEVAARRGAPIEVRRDAAAQAPRLLPANATSFQKGLTVGLSSALLTEPASLAPYLREALELLEPPIAAS